MKSFRTLADLSPERRIDLDSNKDSRDIESPMSLKDAERDQTAHQRYSGTFSVTGPSSNQTIGNQYARRDLNITTWPNQHVDTEWSQTSHSRPAPPLPPRIIYIAIALRDFQPNAVDELCFKAGDQIELTQGKTPSKDGWLKGRIKGGSGEEGLVPKDYVEIRSDVGLSKLVSYK